MALEIVFTWSDNPEFRCVTATAMGEYGSYLWSNGATGRVITIVEDGVYYVTADADESAHYYVDISANTINTLLSFSFSVESLGSLPPGKYSLEYDTGLDIKLKKAGRYLYLGSSSSPMKYDLTPHLGVDKPKYDSGYTYDSRYPADAIFLEQRLLDKSFNNDLVSNSLGISPVKTNNRLAPFTDSGRHNLMVVHFDDCFDNAAPFYPLYSGVFLADSLFGQAGVFSGTPLVVPNVKYFSAITGTIQMWAKRLCKSRGTKYYIVDMQPFVGSNGLAASFSLYVDEIDNLTFEIIGFSPISGTNSVRTDTFAIHCPLSTKDFNGNEYNHIAITWNNSSSPTDNFMRLYLNGELRSLLKYDTGATFGIDEVTAEERLFGDYADSTFIGGDAQVHVVKARVNKFIAEKLGAIVDPSTVTIDDPTGDKFPRTIAGLESFFNQFVSAVPYQTATYTNDVFTVSNQVYSGTFYDWLALMNEEPTQKYNTEPTEWLDSVKSKSAIKEIRGQSIDNASDFTHIYIGGDIDGLYPGQVLIDQLAIMNAPLSSAELAAFKRQQPISISDSRVTLGYDFNIAAIEGMTFTNLQDEYGRNFEFIVNVLNPFSFPLDKALITNLINMVKPANSTAFVNFA